MTILSFLMITLAGSLNLGYVPPPVGVGSEIVAGNTRSLGMGGVTVGIPDFGSFSILNPAASAWTLEGGVAFTGRYSESDDPAWDNRLGFPMISALLPLPGRVVITGSVQGRSRLETSAENYQVDSTHTGDFSWSGGLVETYVGVSVRASDWLAVSMGGRSTSGTVQSNVDIRTSSSSPSTPQHAIYRDDADFGMAWGPQIGLMVNTPRFGLGFSVSTERRGTLSIDRMYIDSDETESTSNEYTVPGELSLGMSFRPLDRLLLGMDMLKRKSLELLDNKTGRGSIYSLGAEYDLSGDLRARCGYSGMEGLWRDGERTVSAGLGYGFGAGRAGLDLAVSHSFWRDSSDSYRRETSFGISLWASEKWLGE